MAKAGAKEAVEEGAEAAARAAGGGELPNSRPGPAVGQGGAKPGAMPFMVPIERLGAMMENLSARMNQNRLATAGVGGLDHHGMVRMHSHIPEDTPDRLRQKQDLIDGLYSGNGPAVMHHDSKVVDNQESTSKTHATEKSKHPIEEKNKDKDKETIEKQNDIVDDYLNSIVVNGIVNNTEMKKLKNAIQNHVFSVDELSKIRKKMSDLGIIEEYNNALIKIDFGKYLRGLLGAPPTDMKNPHAHHILFKVGLGQKQKELVREGQEILGKYGIDPIIGPENLVWAPNRIAGPHSIEALENVIKQLKAVDAAGADVEYIIEILEDLGKQAASRK
ncbi:AHH domain-containing protein [Paenibacillus wulumuqiensis]|uniref:AHH domain-containing protein n=1 Tax=Paenibacillus wulumuqiensis TaxID=1567107 RepID=UPI000A549E05|nr:AHH domain-containing protein [Paenibacillus wulumuqiensis]